MTTTNNFITRPVDRASLIKKMLLGLGIALVLVAIFLSGVRDPKPEWPTLWMIKPLVIAPLAGAAGGAFYYFISPMHFKSYWKKLLAGIVCLVAYLFALWIGTILGLNGTLWN